MFYVHNIPVIFIVKIYICRYIILKFDLGYANFSIIRTTYGHN